jgi:hypothetical protein
MRDKITLSGCRTVSLYGGEAQEVTQQALTRAVPVSCQRLTLPGCFVRQDNTGDRGERA